MLRLYNKQDCPFCWKVRLAAAELDIKIEVIDHKSDSFRRNLDSLTPKGTVPVLETADIRIFESNVILEFLNETSGALLPLDKTGRAHSRQLNQYVDTVVGAQLREVIFEKRDKHADDWNHDRIALGTQGFEESLAYLAKELGEKEFFTDRYSLPECALTARLGLAQSYGISIPTQYRNLRTWFGRMQSRPSYGLTKPGS